jgi:hypothetical protein
MNPWSFAPPALVAVGKGGSEEVSVVAKRVGLKRRDDACGAGVNTSEFSHIHQARYFALPNETIVTQVLQHRPLSIAQILRRVFLIIALNQFSESEKCRRPLLVQVPLSIT